LAAFEQNGSWRDRKRRKTHIKCGLFHPCIDLLLPCSMDILRILGLALLEIVVETYFSYDI
jgi:hypothetical protein